MSSSENKSLKERESGDQIIVETPIVGAPPDSPQSAGTGSLVAGPDLDFDKTLPSSVPEVSQSRVVLQPGAIIGGKFEIIEQIGSGGMGVIFKAKEPMLAKFFAIKMLNKQGIDPIALQRFQREARAASRLAHQNLIAVHEIGMFKDEHPYMVMDSLLGTGITDRDCASIARLSTLRELSIGHNSNIDDNGIQRLIPLHNLEALRAEENPKIGDAALHSLARFPKLSALCLASTQIDDKGVPSFAKLHHLVDLHLDNTKVDDDGVKSLSNLKLSTLILNGTPITNSSIDILTKLKWLNNLGLVNCNRITDPGLLQLHRSRPDITVNR